MKTLQERLQKFVARSGVASRRKAEKLITSGRVKVNGSIVRELGVKVDPRVDIVTVDGRVLEPEKKVYLLLNKPRGYVTTLHDPQGRPTVADLVRDVKERIFPVGRLDFDTEGLLLLTNDGELAYALTHPKHEINKTYLALVEGTPPPGKIRQMRRGLMLEDGPTAPARVRLVGNQGGNAVLQITIHEGRNRQVRRMCEAVGHPVLSLKRIKMANLELAGLLPGKFRSLTGKELAGLKKLALAGGNNRHGPN